MAKIGIRTNHTREVERAPLLIQPVKAAFWAEILRMAVKPAHTATRLSRKKAVDNSTARNASTPAAKVQPGANQPARPLTHPPAQKAPVNRFPQPGANGQKPLPGSLPGGTNQTNGNRPGGSQPGSNNNNGRPNGLNNSHNNHRGYNRPGNEPPKPPAPRQPLKQPDDRNTPANNPPAQRNNGLRNSFDNSFERLVDTSSPRKPNPDRPNPTGQPNNGNSKGSPIVPNRLSPGQPGGHSEIPQPGLTNPREKPAQPLSSEPSAPVLPEAGQPEKVKPEAEKRDAATPPHKAAPVQSNLVKPASEPSPAAKPMPEVKPDKEAPADQKPRDQAPTQINHQPATGQDNSKNNGSQPGRNGFENAGREKPLESRFSPANGSNGHGKAPVDGMKPHNGTSGSSSLFRSGVYSGMTSFRSRPTPVNPEQIQLSNPNKPADGDQPPAKNGNGKASEPPNLSSTSPKAHSSVPAPALQPRNSATQRQFLLRYLLHEHPELPAQSAIFGVSADDLPVLIDLADPGPGAILTISDERQAEVELLRTVVASLATRNSARGVQFLIFSCDPQSWLEWITRQGYERHCLAVVDVDSEEDSIREWTLQMADWTEQRRLGQRSGPPVVLIMDTLSFLTRLEYDVRLNFEWMAKEGPQAQIWPVAAISSELARSLNSRRLLRAFQTRILGCLDNPADYTQLTRMDEQAAADFGQPGEFAVQLGEDWLRFCLLSLK